MLFRIFITLLVFVSCQFTVRAEQNTVRVVADIDYVPQASYQDNRNKLDLYLPEGRQKFPVLLLIHGGALMRGDKEGSSHKGRRFASDGIGTVNRELACMKRMFRLMFQQAPQLVVRVLHIPQLKETTFGQDFSRMKTSSRSEARCPIMRKSLRVLPITVA